MTAVATRPDTRRTDPYPLRPSRPERTRPARIGSVDLLRGLVMVLMALDHVRAYFTDIRFDPTDLALTTTPLFLTRWITHFCAPTFVLLAGTSAWMTGRRRSRDELARFLASRGLWLVVLEFTVVNFGWYFNLEYQLGFVAQVIWAIGMSMIVLAGLVYLPRWAIAAAAFGMIAGHNLLDGFAPAAGSALWAMLHVQRPVEELGLFVVYPLIPWIGVMAAGYLLGPVLERGLVERERTLWLLGGAVTALFVVVRSLNVYGDPVPWAPQATALGTVLSFLDASKYPPSLVYLLMTLGPGLLALAALERLRGRPAQWLTVFGQVPLFFYVAHIYLVHTLALLAGLATGHEAGAMARLYIQLPPDYGFSLPVVYLGWVVVLLSLWPACHWYAALKRRGRGWWWSYV